MPRPAAPARIFIVDDSAVMRSLLRTVVEVDPRFVVAGTASDGASALRALESLRPDLILLDVEMPVMDGLSTLKQMRQRGSHIPVIMCSALTQSGARVTIEALASGASDYVAKPSGQPSREAAVQALANDLIPKFLALTRSPSWNAHPASLLPPSSPPSGPPNQPTPLPAEPTGTPGSTRSNALIRSLGSIRPQTAGHSGHSNSGQPFPLIRPQPSAALPRTDPSILLIGVSTGGPAALDVLLPALPADFPLPVLIVQHMPEIFTRHLAERLDTRCALQVCEALSGQAIRAGVVYIAKGNWHLEVRRAASPNSMPGSAHSAARAAGQQTVPSVMRLTQDPLENHCRPAVDVLFRTGVAVYGPGTLAVVLTGMGSDGLAGCRLIREQGGVVLVQDEATSAVWGMPGVVAQAGLAHSVLPLNAIAPEILRIVSQARHNREKPNPVQHEALELRDSAGRH